MFFFFILKKEIFVINNSYIYLKTYYWKDLFEEIGLKPTQKLKELCLKYHLHIYLYIFCIFSVLNYISISTNTLIINNWYMSKSTTSRLMNTIIWMKCSYKLPFHMRYNYNNTSHQIYIKNNWFKPSYWFIGVDWMYRLIYK